MRPRYVTFFEPYEDGWIEAPPYSFYGDRPLVGDHVETAGGASPAYARVGAVIHDFDANLNVYLVPVAWFGQTRRLTLPVFEPSAPP
jgi:hypothetical protein